MKTCRACGDVLPIEQFRPVKPREPGQRPSRFHKCRECEREGNRVRANRLYNADPVYREKQLANATIQRVRQQRRRSTE